MDRNRVLLNHNIARPRRDVRLQSWQLRQLIAADLVLFIEKRERLKAENV